MGLTKRVAELIVVALSPRAEATVLSAVRFVNVLGSRGSVVPMLLRQIDAGGPVTITDPEAHRFFMTVAEAASLVLRCVALAVAGAIFVLDMGDELRIVDLAERLVRLKGLRPGRDITFEYVGLRPGERLHEQLAADDEVLAATAHPNIHRIEPAYTVDGQRLLEGVRALDARRRAGEIPLDGYAPALRTLIDSAVRPAQPSLA
jgi:FlaA1/EpsC-like NDP-sugar epimerase